MKRFHSENPYKDYVSKEQLRDEVDISQDWLSHVVESMANDVVKMKRGYALKDHSVSLSDSTIEKVHYGIVTVNPEATKV